MTDIGALGVVGGACMTDKVEHMGQGRVRMSGIETLGSAMVGEAGRWRAGTGGCCMAVIGHSWTSDGLVRQAGGGRSTDRR
jgi:hypothetical protein